MRNIRKAVACLAALLLVLSTFPLAFTASADASGTCGVNVSWSISGGVLTITGSGAIPDYDPPGSDAPWFQSGESYSSIVIGSGITRIGEWAFGYSEATSVSIPNTVTSIGTGAFSSSGLTSVTIPGSVQSWQEAFVLCNSLTTATIQSGVTAIDIYSFAGCENLTTVSIPASVTSIGNAAFNMCSSLTSVTLPPNLQSIGDGAFSLTGLTAVQIPNTVTTLGEATFGGLAITEIVLPPNLTIIPDSLLSNCALLTDVTIPDGVTAIGYDAFSYCTSLTNIHIPSSVQTIADYAFSGCTNLSYICSPVENGAAQQYADANNIPFQRCGTPANACGDNLTWSIENGVLTITGTGDMYDYFNPNEEDPTIPPWAEETYHEVVIGSGVTSIGSDAFVNNAELTTVTIPNTVTSIGDEAFLFCENLSGVVIPDSVETIGERAFLYCTGMSTLTLGSGVTEIKIGAFAVCSSLSSVVIPDSVETIGVSAFSQCSDMTTLTIGSGVTSIGATAFESCTSLTEINYNIPNLADLTNEHGLFACSTSENTPVTVNFGANVQHIPAYLFDRPNLSDGPRITEVNFGRSLASVGQNAFNGCTSIVSINYAGTQRQWNSVTIYQNNAPLLNVTPNCTGTEEANDQYSVSVGDQVALNLLLDLDARDLEVSDIVITLDGQPCDATVTNEGDQYRFTIITAPAQIAAPILITAGGETLATTSVMAYCVALCSPEYDEYHEEQELARAILQYGKAANDWFKYSEDEITTFGLLDHTAVQNYNRAIFTDGTHKITGASFMALAKPDFRFYMNDVTEAEAFAYNQAGISAYYRNEDVHEELHACFKKSTRNGQAVVLVEVTGVSAENMEEEIIVSIPGLGEFTFNGNAFAKAMANQTGSDPDAVATRNLGAALFNYGEAANACFCREDQP